MMKRFWLGVLYLSGWHISTCLLYYYHYIAEPMTWDEAQRYCRRIYTDLVTITDVSVMNQLINSYKYAVWIGLYTEIDWRWSDGYTGSNADYRKWENVDDNEPDFYSMYQFCVTIEDDGGWWDTDCMEKFSSFCYTGSQEDPDFVFVPELKTWSEAQAYCRENHVDMATVRSDTHNQEIVSKMLGTNVAWIGLFRDPNIYWSDGSGFSFSNWYEGSNVLGPRLLCGLAFLYDSGKWDLKFCDAKFPFICYSIHPPVYRYVVKLRIKPEDTSLDLNDDAVKANILKKLQERLKEKGVTGVALKWREQSVFHKEEQVQKKLTKKTEL